MKKVLIGLAALAVVVIVAVAYVWSNLDGIVKDAIQTYGSEATKTAVNVASVKIDLSDGKAKISGLTVANPKGFSAPNIFKLGSISTKIDLSTLRKNPVVIDEIDISAPSVFYEINKAGVSNVDVLKKNLGVGGGSGGSASSSGSSSEVKMIIRKLVVEGSTAEVRIAALAGREQSVSLPRIVMTDIGKKSNGATATEVATQLSQKLLGNVQSSVASLGVDKYLGKSADQIKQKMQGAMTGGGASDATKKAGDALKGLLGN